MHVPKALVEHQNRRKMAHFITACGRALCPPPPPPRPCPIPLRCVSITSHSGLILMRCEIIYERRPSSWGLIGPRAHAPSAPAQEELKTSWWGWGWREKGGEGRPDPWTIPNRALWLLNLRDNREMSGGTPPHRPPPAAVSFMAA